MRRFRWFLGLMVILGTVTSPLLTAWAQDASPAVVDEPISTEPVATDPVVTVPDTVETPPPTEPVAPVETATDAPESTTPPTASVEVNDFSAAAAPVLTVGGSTTSPASIPFGGQTTVAVSGLDPSMQIFFYAAPSGCPRDDTGRSPIFVPSVGDISFPRTGSPGTTEYLQAQLYGGEWSNCIQVNWIAPPTATATNAPAPVLLAGIYLGTLTEDTQISISASDTFQYQGQDIPALLFFMGAGCAAGNYGYALPVPSGVMNPIAIAQENQLIDGAFSIQGYSGSIDAAGQPITTCRTIMVNGLPTATATSAPVPSLAINNDGTSTFLQLNLGDWLDVNPANIPVLVWFNGGGCQAGNFRYETVDPVPASSITNGYDPSWFVNNQFSLQGYSGSFNSAGQPITTCRTIEVLGRPTATATDTLAPTVPSTATATIDPAVTPSSVLTVNGGTGTVSVVNGNSVHVVVSGIPQSGTAVLYWNAAGCPDTADPAELGLIGLLDDDGDGAASANRSGLFDTTLYYQANDGQWSNCVRVDWSAPVVTPTATATIASAVLTVNGGGGPVNAVNGQSVHVVASGITPGDTVSLSWNASGCPSASDPSGTDGTALKDSDWDGVVSSDRSGLTNATRYFQVSSQLGWSNCVRVDWSAGPVTPTATETATATATATATETATATAVPTVPDNSLLINEQNGTPRTDAVFQLTMGDFFFYQAENIPVLAFFKGADCVPGNYGFLTMDPDLGAMNTAAFADEWMIDNAFSLQGYSAPPVSGGEPITSCRTIIASPAPTATPETPTAEDSPTMVKTETATVEPSPTATQRVLVMTVNGSADSPVNVPAEALVYWVTSGLDPAGTVSYGFSQTGCPASDPSVTPWGPFPVSAGGTAQYGAGGPTVSGVTWYIQATQGGVWSNCIQLVWASEATDTVTVAPTDTATAAPTSTETVTAEPTNIATIAPTDTATAPLPTATAGGPEMHLLINNDDSAVVYVNYPGSSVGILWLNVPLVNIYANGTCSGTPVEQDAAPNATGQRYATTGEWATLVGGYVFSVQGVTASNTVALTDCRKVVMMNPPTATIASTAIETATAVPTDTATVEPPTATTEPSPTVGQPGAMSFTVNNQTSGTLTLNPYDLVTLRSENVSLIVVYPGAGCATAPAYQYLAPIDPAISAPANEWITSTPTTSFSVQAHGMDSSTGNCITISIIQPTDTATATGTLVPTETMMPSAIAEPVLLVNNLPDTLVQVNLGSTLFIHLEGLPKLVWFHGGGCATGSFWYDAAIGISDIAYNTSAFDPAAFIDGQISIQGYSASISAGGQPVTTCRTIEVLGLPTATATETAEATVTATQQVVAPVMTVDGSTDSPANVAAGAMVTMLTSGLTPGGTVSYGYSQTACPSSVSSPALQGPYTVPDSGTHQFGAGGEGIAGVSWYFQAVQDGVWSNCIQIVWAAAATATVEPSPTATTTAVPLLLINDLTNTEIHVDYFNGSIAVDWNGIPLLNLYPNTDCSGMPSLHYSGGSGSRSYPAMSWATTVGGYVFSLRGYTSPNPTAITTCRVVIMDNAPVTPSVPATETATTAPTETAMATIEPTATATFIPNLTINDLTDPVVHVLVTEDVTITFENIAVLGFYAGVDCTGSPIGSWGGAPFTRTSSAAVLQSQIGASIFSMRGYDASSDPVTDCRTVVIDEAVTATATTEPTSTNTAIVEPTETASPSETPAVQPTSTETATAAATSTATATVAPMSTSTSTATATAEPVLTVNGYTDDVVHVWVDGNVTIAWENAPFVVSYRSADCTGFGAPVGGNPSVSLGQLWYSWNLLHAVFSVRGQTTDAAGGPAVTSCRTIYLDSDDQPTATTAPSATTVPTSTATTAPTATATETETIEPTNTATVVPTHTATAVPTETVAPTDTATSVPTSTPTPTDTVVPTATKTVVNTETPAATNAATATATMTTTSTATETVAATETATGTTAPTNTATTEPTSTATSEPTSTATFAPTATTAPTNTATSAPTSTATIEPTGTATLIPAGTLRVQLVTTSGDDIPAGTTWMLSLTNEIGAASGVSGRFFAAQLDTTQGGTLNADLLSGSELPIVNPVALGMYTLTIDAPGYRPVVQAIDLRDPDATTAITVRLVPVATATATTIATATPVVTPTVTVTNAAVVSDLPKTGAGATFAGIWPLVLLLIAGGLAMGGMAIGLWQRRR